MNNKRILLVDDDPFTRYDLYVRLTAKNYGVLLAADGSTSVTVATSHEPDLIILDVALPSGDGVTVMERFRANDRLALTPVVVLSGRDRHANQERSRKAGAEARLQNPMASAELLAVIRQILGECTKAEKPVVNNQTTR